MCAFNGQKELLGARAKLGLHQGKPVSKELCGPIQARMQICKCTYRIRWSCHNSNGCRQRLVVPHTSQIARCPSYVCVVTVSNTLHEHMFAAREQHRMQLQTSLAPALSRTFRQGNERAQLLRCYPPTATLPHTLQAMRPRTQQMQRTCSTNRHATHANRHSWTCSRHLQLACFTWK